MMKDDKENRPFKSSIAPWLAVDDAAKAVDFYQAAFGAAELYRLDDGEGRPVIAELAVGEAGFWVQADAGAGIGNGGGPIRFILTVADPDAVFGQAIRAGAAEIVPVGEGHGWRIGRLADPFGYHWEVGRRLE